jgi:hypothetical protein
MTLNLICSGFLIRYPLGGHTWHHVQYLAGLAALGHRVTYIEDYGWDASCFDPAAGAMTDDPTYGIEYFSRVLEAHNLDIDWCYLAAAGTPRGMSRHELAARCRAADLYLNLDGVNHIPETALCRRRALIDVDPVFTQIGGHGLAGSLANYDVLFTYGENVHRRGCDMPTGGARWLPTRQPVVLDMWDMTPGEPSAPLTTVINWSAYGDREYQGRVYGQKDREFEPFFDLPHEVDRAMELAVNPPDGIRERLLAGGWSLIDPFDVTRSPCDYQRYLRASRGEFCVAKHAYVSTRCGWFSDRSAGYLASGRPVVVQDTGFSDFLPGGEGLLPFNTPAEARAAIAELDGDYERHCLAARQIARHFFDARTVLCDVLERSL